MTLIIEKSGKLYAKKGLIKRRLQSAGVFSLPVDSPTGRLTFQFTNGKISYLSGDGFGTLSEYNNKIKKYLPTVITALVFLGVIGCLILFII